VKSGVRRWLLAMLLLRLAYKVIGAPPGQGPKPPSKVRKIKWGSIALYLTLLLLSGAFGLGLYLDATASPATPPDGYFLAFVDDSYSRTRFGGGFGTIRRDDPLSLQVNEHIENPFGKSPTVYYEVHVLGKTSTPAGKAAIGKNARWAIALVGSSELSKPRTDPEIRVQSDSLEILTRPDPSSNYRWLTLDAQIVTGVSKVVASVKPDDPIGSRFSGATKVVGEKRGSRYLLRLPHYNVAGNWLNPRLNVTGYIGSALQATIGLRPVPQNTQVSIVYPQTSVAEFTVWSLSESSSSLGEMIRPNLALIDPFEAQREEVKIFAAGLLLAVAASVIVAMVQTHVGSGFVRYE
jgi:hypothetical protein